MQRLPTIGNAKELCSQKLKDLKSFITPKDKLSAKEQLNYSRQTIDSYLNGAVNKVDVAMDLIDFFEPIVGNRLSRLQTNVA